MFCRFNFFAALYLAHDMFEDSDEAKWEILPWALGRRWKLTIRQFIRTKNEVCN
jgi:speedy